MKTVFFYCLVVCFFLVGCSSPKERVVRDSRGEGKRREYPRVRFLGPPNMRAAGTRLVPLGAFVIPNRELRRKYGPLPRGTISVPKEGRSGRGNGR